MTKLIDGVEQLPVRRVGPDLRIDIGNVPINFLNAVSENIREVPDAPLSALIGHIERGEFNIHTGRLAHDLAEEQYTLHSDAYERRGLNYRSGYSNSIVCTIGSDAKHDGGDIRLFLYQSSQTLGSTPGVFGMLTRMGLPAGILPANVAHDLFIKLGGNVINTTKEESLIVPNAKSFL